jgi:hypothetical protein
VRLRLSSAENSDVFVYEIPECAPIIDVGQARMRAKPGLLEATSSPPIHQLALGEIDDDRHAVSIPAMPFLVRVSTKQFLTRLRLTAKTETCGVAQG